MENVAIVGVGMTKHVSKRRDVNIAELINEAVENVFKETGLRPADIDAIVFGNMHTFEGVNQPELWAGDLMGGYMKPVLRTTTGGSTGATVAQSAYYHVASGFFDTVLAVAFEKQSDGDTQTGLGAIIFPELSAITQLGGETQGPFGSSGGSTGGAAFQAASYVQRTGCTDEVLCKVVVKNRRLAAKNPYAHLQMPNLTVEDVMNTAMVSYPLRFGHTCPTSDGACAMIMMSGKKAEQRDSKVAWINGVATCSDSPNFHPYEGIMSDPSDQRSCIEAAKRAYAMAGIKNPRKQIDVAEVYNAWAHQELMWCERLMLCEEGKGPQMFEDGITQFDGELPVNASGGVLSTNAIGATAMIRVAEAALQVMGKAGEHQVPKRVRNAVAHGWGGLFQFNVVTVLGDKPRRGRA